MSRNSVETKNGVFCFCILTSHLARENKKTKNTDIEYGINVYRNRTAWTDVTWNENESNGTSKFKILLNFFNSRDQDDHPKSQDQLELLCKKLKILGYTVPGNI